ncbi:MAG: HepT-like ribonuclease domain-containing protein [Acidobacteriota bacterium]
MEATSTIAEFLKGRSESEFDHDKLLRSAILNQLTIIGEAASRLSDDLRSSHPEIPWHAVRGLRNIVVHNYFGVDWNQVWATVLDDIPVLARQVEEMIQQPPLGTPDK